MGSIQFRFKLILFDSVPKISGFAASSVNGGALFLVRKQPSHLEAYAEILLKQRQKIMFIILALLMYYSDKNGSPNFEVLTLSEIKLRKVLNKKVTK